jgi:hypothetical protein
MQKARGEAGILQNVVGGARRDRTVDLLNAILIFCVSPSFLGLH